MIKMPGVLLNIFGVLFQQISRYFPILFQWWSVAPNLAVACVRQPLCKTSFGLTTFCWKLLNGLVRSMSFLSFIVLPPSWTTYRAASTYYFDSNFYKVFDRKQKLKKQTNLSPATTHDRPFSSSRFFAMASWSLCTIHGHKVECQILVGPFCILCRLDKAFQPFPSA